MSTLLQDLRYGLRMLAKNPGFTAVAALTLGVAIGTHTAIFSFVDALYFKALPVPHSEQLVKVYAKGREGHYFHGFSYPEYHSLAGHASAFAALTGESTYGQIHVAAGGASEEVRASFVTDNYFTALGAQPILGRSFLPEEDAVPDRNGVAVVSQRLWQSLLGGSAAALGRRIAVNGVPVEVIGVAPPGFYGDEPWNPSDLWMPAMMLNATGHSDCPAYDCTTLEYMVGKLAPAHSPSDAQAEAEGRIVWAATDYPERPSLREIAVVPAIGVDPLSRSESRAQVQLLMAITMTLLLIACANVAGLFIARGVTRRKEMAVRLSLGASRFRIARQVLTEGLLLAVLGGAVGLLVSAWGKDELAAFLAVDSEGYQHLYDLGPDWRILLYSLLVVLFAGLLFGVLPALRASRQDLVGELKEGGGVGPGRSGWLRRTLVTSQVALSLVLLVSAGLLVRSARNLRRGTNFDPEHVVVLRVRPELVKYSPERVVTYFRQVISRLNTTPGVEAVAMCRGGEGLVWNWRNGRQVQVILPGQTPAFRGAAPSIRHQDVGPHFFQALRIPIVAGREFTERDGVDAPRDAVVNEALSRQLWPQGSALGQSLIIDGQPSQVVGVAASIQPPNPLQQPEPRLYLSYWQSDPGKEGDLRLAVRVAGDPALALPGIRRVVHAVDPNVPLGEDMPMTEQINLEYLPLLVASNVMIYCGLLALCLSAMGLYSVLAFVVRSRTREIGVRIALGARANDVFALVLKQGGAVTLVGVAAGLLIALAATRLLASWLYGVRSFDPAVLVIVAALIGLIAVVASYLPARRATKVDPMVALRYE